MTGKQASAVSTQRVTAEQLLRMGEGRRELVQGEIISLTPAGWEHGEVANEIAYHLNVFVRQRGLGRVVAAETGFILSRDPDTVRAPDVAFVCNERWTRTAGFFPGAPDLAIEVVLPHDRFSDVSQKVHDWLIHGARQVWVVDPNRRVIQVHQHDGTVAELGEGEVIDGGDLLPGLRLAVRECFPATPL